MNNQELFDEIKRIKSIADLGLLYCNNEYDKERYLDLQETCLRLMEKFTGQHVEALKNFYPLVSEYPTAKVDIRGFALTDDHKILLVKERSDERWSLPGGWADIGYTPKEIIVKEFKEETGLDIVPHRLVAVFDKKKHPHPPQLLYCYKMVFHCIITSFSIQKGFDVLDVGYFDVNNLPALSENRILKTQIELLFQKVTSADSEVYVD